MKVTIIREKAPKDQIKALAEANYGSMFKLAVDIERKILAAGGEFHADGEQMLIGDGSKQKDIWGANYYPFEKAPQRIQYTALINIRPQDNNKGMLIENETIRHKIKAIVESLLLGPNDAAS